MALDTRHGVTYIKKTRAQIEALRLAGELIAGCLYETTDEPNGEPRRGRAVKVDKILWDARIYDEEYDSDQDAMDRGNLSVGDSYILSANNEVGIPGIHKKILAAIVFIIMSIASSNAQIVQRSGLPNVNPTTNGAYIWHDTLNKQLFQYKRPKWYLLSTIINETEPAFESTTSGVTVSNTEAEWYKPSLGRYKYQNSKWTAYGQISSESAPTISTSTVNNAQATWYKPSTGKYYRVSGSAWVNNDNVNLDSLVTIHYEQTILGKKRFADTVKADKGLISSGLIDSKGVKSDGSSTVAAINANGVQKSATVTITGNATLDGTYNTIYANTASGNITVTLPSVTSNNTGWSYSIMKTSSSNTLFIARPSSSAITIVSNNYSITVKNNGTSWEVQ